MNFSDIVLGALIGGGFAIAGSVLQSLLQWFLNWRKSKQEEKRIRFKERCEKEGAFLDKREAAYNAYVKLMEQILFCAIARGPEGGRENDVAFMMARECVTKQEFAQRITDCMADILFYGSKEMALRCNHFKFPFDKIASISQQNEAHALLYALSNDMMEELKSARRKLIDG